MFRLIRQVSEKLTHVNSLDSLYGGENDNNSIFFRFEMKKCEQLSITKVDLLLYIDIQIEFFHFVLLNVTKSQTRRHMYRPTPETELETCLRQNTKMH